jgi:hypothetical protein
MFMSTRSSSSGGSEGMPGPAFSSSRPAPLDEASAGVVEVDRRRERGQLGIAGV